MMKIINYIIAIFLLPMNIWKLKEKANKKPYQIAYYAKLKLSGSYIGHTSIWGKNICFPHGQKGIFVSGGATIGDNCVIFQHVTIGSNSLEGSKRNGSPIIGDNCFIGAGAIIIGNVVIGNNVRIGAGAVVVDDVPENATVVSQKPVIIQNQEPLDNRFFSSQNGEKCYWNEGKWIKI